MLGITDYFKAIVAAIIIMAVNVALSYGVMAVYSHIIDPGHDLAFYQSAAQQIAPWSSVVAGVFLFFGAAYWLGQSRPGRNAIHMALTMFIAYAAIEIIIMSGAGQLMKMINIILLSLATKLAASLLGGARAAA